MRACVRRCRQSNCACDIVDLIFFYLTKHGGISANGIKEWYMYYDKLQPDACFEEGPTVC